MTRAVAPTDPIESFYDEHPYPPPVTDAGNWSRQFGDEAARRAAHHLIWPARSPSAIRSVLVAGCGTSQAVRHALRHPDAQVVGIDVSESSLAHTRALAEAEGIENLELQLLPIEAATQLDRSFDHIVCTGVLHHLADPEAGLRSLRSVLAPHGAITLMVYAPYGRAGVYLVQEYCRRLGIGTGADEIEDLVATLREIPEGHPLGRLLRTTRDFAAPDALADALLNPRDRPYSVPQLLELLVDAGLRFGRWQSQAPYLPTCGSLSETPHAPRIAALPASEQYEMAELLRGTMLRHTVVAFAAEDRTSGLVDFGAPSIEDWVPVAVPTATVVQERLPPGAAAVLLNRAHSDTDLIRFVDQRELDLFRQIDGERSIRSLGEGALGFVQQLWNHDLVVLDGSASEAAA